MDLAQILFANSTSRDKLSGTKSLPKHLPNSSYYWLKI